MEYSYRYLQDYRLYYAPYGHLFFLAKARNDVHVTLSTIKGNSDSYEIVIGGWGNTISAIRFCHQCDNMVEKFHTPLNENFFQPFWVSWSESEIRVGQGTELFKDELLHLDAQTPKSINYIGISTGYEAGGTWIFSKGVFSYESNVAVLLSCALSRVALTCWPTNCWYAGGRRLHCSEITACALYGLIPIFCSFVFPILVRQ